MYKILIWGTGKEYNTYFNCIKFLEYKNQISVVGVISNDTNIKKYIDGYQFIAKESIKNVEYDYCVVAMVNMESAISEATKLGIHKSKLIPARVFSIPNIDFNEYIKLKESHVSILSSLCWGGICYHKLGLEFLSPTIKMFEDTDDFNKLMMNLDYYMSLPVEFLKRHDEFNYPIGMLGDIQLNFQHYESYEEAVSCWNRRKRRINRENIVVVSYSDSEETIYNFEKLPYKNKLIFTSLEIDTPSKCHVNLDSQGSLATPVNATAFGHLNMLDIIAFLNHKDDFIRFK